MLSTGTLFAISLGGILGLIALPGVSVEFGEDRPPKKSDLKFLTLSLLIVLSFAAGLGFFMVYTALSPEKGWGAYLGLVLWTFLSFIFTDAVVKGRVLYREIRNGLLEESKQQGS